MTNKSNQTRSTSRWLRLVCKVYPQKYRFYRKNHRMMSPFNYLNNRRKPKLKSRSQIKTCLVTSIPFWCQKFRLACTTVLDAVKMRFTRVIQSAVMKILGLVFTQISMTKRPFWMKCLKNLQLQTTIVVKRMQIRIIYRK